MVNWIKDDDLAKKKLGKLYCGRRKNLQKKFGVAWCAKVKVLLNGREQSGGKSL